MFDRAKIAAESFNQTNSSGLNISISTIFGLTFFAIIIALILVFNYIEKKSKFDIFKRRLAQSGLSKKEQKIVFKYLENRYHGYLIPFFLFKKIAIDALKKAGVKNPEEVFNKIEKIKD